MAGTGKLATIKELGFKGKITCNDLEKEWVNSSYGVDCWHFTDAARMDWAKDGEFDAICTSPTYGNRMADHHDARDGSKRYTYKHCLGHDLHEGNTGMMQWGEEYRIKNIAIIKECYRVLKTSCPFIINISNHVRQGKVINVVGWWKEILNSNGFILESECEVKTRRMRNGENASARVATEFILIFLKL